MRVQFEKVIVILDEDNNLVGLSRRDDTKRSMIDFICTEVGTEDKIALMEKLCNKEKKICLNSENIKKEG